MPERCVSNGKMKRKNKEGEVSATSIGMAESKRKKVETIVGQQSDH